MCGRYASHLPPEEIARLFSTVGDLPNIGANWNLAPTDPAMVVRRHPASGERGWICCAGAWCRILLRT